MSKDRQKKGVNGFIILENNENRLKEHIMRSDLYKNRYKVSEMSLSFFRFFDRFLYFNGFFGVSFMRSWSFIEYYTVVVLFI